MGPHIRLMVSTHMWVWRLLLLLVRRRIYIYALAAAPASGGVTECAHTANP
jgi:hypothetical protein